MLRGALAWYVQVRYLIYPMLIQNLSGLEGVITFWRMDGKDELEETCFLPIAEVEVSLHAPPYQDHVVARWFWRDGMHSGGGLMNMNMDNQQTPWRLEPTRIANPPWMCIPNVIEDAASSCWFDRDVVNMRWCVYVPGSWSHSKQAKRERKKKKSNILSHFLNRSIPSKRTSEDTRSRKKVMESSSLLRVCIFVRGSPQEPGPKCLVWVDSESCIPGSAPAAALRIYLLPRIRNWFFFLALRYQ